MVRRLAAALLAALCTGGAQAQGNLVDVVEFYNVTLDHYFVSSLAADIGALDSGTFKGWSRTGLSFKAYGGAAAGASPVCRFYIPPAQGDSHFYSASPAECAEVAQKFPGFSYESPAVMYEGLPEPVTGACAPGTVPVYRLWNRRADTNHRYTTDAAVRGAMVAKGYVPEGYGPDGVAMCAPSAVERFEVTIAPASLLLLPGESRDVWVTVRPRGGFAGTVALGVTGMTSGVTAQLSSASLGVGTGAVSASLRIAASSSAPLTEDLAPLAVTASEDGGFSVTRVIGVGVVAAEDAVATRLRAIAAVEQRAQELRNSGLTRLALAQAVAGFMATRSEYVASGVDAETSTAWGRFDNGSMHGFAANRDPAPRSEAALQVLPLARDGAEIPARMEALLLHPFGRNFQNQAAIDDMRRYFVAKGWNVQSMAEGDANVETLRNVAGKGFFYINTHTFRLEVKDLSEPDGKMFWLQSSTVVRPALDRAYAAELASLQLAPMTAENGDEFVGADGGVRRGYDTRYGFSYRFVDRFMSFPPGSVVFINGCHSGRNDRFVSAFLRKGAALYLGWSESCTGPAADKVPPYFVDRMLGSNMHSDKESPPQRAFPASLVLADMARKGLDIDPVTLAKLSSFIAPGLAHPPIFAPSIRMAAVDEIDGLLTLHGYFGTDGGTVTVGGEKLGIVSWAADEIAANLPLTGAGSSGDVVVEVRGVKSNARQITQWSVDVEFTETVPLMGSFKFKGGGSMRFRGDVAGWRTEPGGPVHYAERGGFATRDSKISVTASGTWSQGPCTSTLSGSWDYPSAAAQKGLSTGMPVTRALFGVQADTKQGAYGFSLEGKLLPHTVTDCAGQKTYTIATMGRLKVQLLLPDSQDDEPNLSGIPGYRFSLGADFAMPPQSSSENGAGIVPGVTASTKAATAVSPPRDSDDSGK
ncbi:MAG: hypothetical protein U1F58_12330 [Burkholderiales bacterium]